jgi:hypothetical protein
MKRSNRITVEYKGWKAVQEESYAIWHTIGLYIFDETNKIVVHEELSRSLKIDEIKEHIEHYQERVKNV